MAKPAPWETDAPAAPAPAAEAPAPAPEPTKAEQTSTKPAPWEVEEKPKAEKPKKQKEEPTYKGPRGVHDMPATGGPHTPPGMAPFSIKETGKAVADALLGPVEAGAQLVGQGIVHGAGQALGGLAGAGKFLAAKYGGASTEDAVNAGVQTSEDVAKLGGLTAKADEVLAPQTQMGKFTSNMVNGAFQAPGKALEYVGDKAGALVGPRTQAAMSSAGKFIGDAAPVAMGLRGVGKAIDETKPIPLAQPQEAMVEAQRNGFLLMPTQGNPSVKNSVVSTLAEPHQLQANIGAQNIKHASGLARQDLQQGLNPQAPGAAALAERLNTHLDRDTVRAVHANANTTYDKLAALPDVIRPTPEYLAQIADLDADFKAMKDFTPSMYNNPKVERMMEDLANFKNPEHPPTPGTPGLPAVGPTKAYPQGFAATPGTPGLPAGITVKGIIEISRYIKSSASKELANISRTAEQEDAALAGLHAASALDGLLAKYLDSTGKADLAAEFQQARQLHAKAHDIEATTNLTTGKIDPAALARVSTKKPLSGNLQKVAHAAEAGVPMTENTVMSGADRISAGGLKAIATGLGATAGTLLGHGVAGGAIGMVPGYMAGEALRAGAQKLGSSKAFQKGGHPAGRANCCAVHDERQGADWRCRSPTPQTRRTW